MRKLSIVFCATILFVLNAESQDSVAVQYRKQTIRLYAQAGIMSSKSEVFNPSSNSRTYFKTGSISYPAFGVGAIIEGKMTRPKVYLGAGLSYGKMNYGGERVVFIPSPSSEELEVYEIEQGGFNFELFIGHYIFLNDQFALKPQASLILQSMKDYNINIDIYNNRNGDYKRTVKYENDGRTSMTGAGALFFSFRKKIEAGIVYNLPLTTNVSRNYATRVSAVGGLVRYIHTF